MSVPIQILYVEDDEDIRDIAEMTLDEKDFALVVCESGNVALEKGALIGPDVFLLDVMMPVMDGPTTLVKLRKFSHLTTTPAIFMTAKVQQNEIDVYRKLGAIGVISKPFDPMELGDEIKHLLDGVL
ncbi:response regulator [Candidatus Enterovibrio escicola]|uniref:Two-component response regulator n=1 Tax=Candidatus Enterovibrio escicola TaxID=1927127 RepID=A0A2A5T5N6_9GAMM|nr:response regulator [Candidatus Enterovibrio escacola]PCS23462.1 Two-component response regulator [Candidatus Enterovibrio escacola]